MTLTLTATYKMQNNTMRMEWVKKNKQAHLHEINEKKTWHMSCLYVHLFTVSSYMFKNLMYVKEARRNKFKS